MFKAFLELLYTFFNSSLVGKARAEADLPSIIWYTSLAHTLYKERPGVCYFVRYCWACYSFFVSWERHTLDVTHHMQFKFLAALSGKAYWLTLPIDNTCEQKSFQPFEQKQRQRGKGRGEVCSSSDFWSSVLAQNVVLKHYWQKDVVIILSTETRICQSELESDLAGNVCRAVYKEKNCPVGNRGSDWRWTCHLLVSRGKQYW